MCISLCSSHFLIKRLSFCKVNVLSHSYCFHSDVLKVACSDSRMNRYGGLSVLTLITRVDPPYAVLSYIPIICSVVKVTFLEALNKALAHVSHVGAAVVFSVSWVFFRLSLGFSTGFINCPLTLVQLSFPWSLCWTPSYTMWQLNKSTGPFSSSSQQNWEMFDGGYSSWI